MDLNVSHPPKDHITNFNSRSRKMGLFSPKPSPRSSYASGLDLESIVSSARPSTKDLTIEEQEELASRRRSMFVPSMDLDLEFSDEEESNHGSQPENEPDFDYKEDYEETPQLIGGCKNADILDYDIFEERERMNRCKEKLRQDYNKLGRCRHYVERTP